MKYYDEFNSEGIDQEPFEEKKNKIKEEDMISVDNQNNINKINNKEILSKSKNNAMLITKNSNSSLIESIVKEINDKIKTQNLEKFNIKELRKEGSSNIKQEDNRNIQDLKEKKIKTEIIKEKEIPDNYNFKDLKNEFPFEQSSQSSQELRNLFEKVDFNLFFHKKSEQEDNSITHNIENSTTLNNNFFPESSKINSENLLAYEMTKDNKAPANTTKELSFDEEHIIKKLEEKENLGKGNFIQEKEVVKENKQENKSGFDKNCFNKIDILKDENKIIQKPKKTIDRKTYLINKIINIKINKKEKENKK